MQYTNKFSVLQSCASAQSGRVQNVHLKFATFNLRALPVASTQWCAFKRRLLALALFDATLLALAGDKLPADLGCLGKCCPERFIHITSLDPTPVRW